MCVCARVCACVRAWVHACACVRPRVCVDVLVCVFQSACVCKYMSSVYVCQDINDMSDVSFILRSHT